MRRESERGVAAEYRDELGAERAAAGMKAGITPKNAWLGADLEHRAQRLLRCARTRTRPAPIPWSG